MTKTEKAYEMGFNAKAGETNPFSFNSGRASYLAWAKGYKARSNATRADTLAWLA